METREFAERILRSTSLEEKLERNESELTDNSPGKPLRLAEPARPENLQFAARRTTPKMPAPVAFSDPAKRAVAHHIMANHELQALEVMAWVLCAFPDSPPEFRSGMLAVMADEQRHTRMHIERAESLGLSFGDLPVNCYIWKKAQGFECILDYLAGLPLTFEGRNLDHTLEFADHFEQAGDPKSAAIMKAIHRDEIEHVAFGLDWLRRLKPPSMTDWEAYCAHLKWPLRPAKAKGDTYNRESRRAAGLDDDFIARLEATSVDDPDEQVTATSQLKQKSPTHS